MSDSQLDRELQLALGVEPSPQFLARVRARIGAQPGGWAWRRAVWGLGMPQLVAAGIAGVVLAVAVPQWTPDKKQPNQQAADQRAVAGSVQQPAARVVPVNPVRAVSPVVRPVARTATTKHTPLRLREPLFSDDERRAFVQFVAAAAQGQVVETPPVIAAAHQSGTDALRIEPLVIDPLPQLAQVMKEGESQW